MSIPLAKMHIELTLKYLQDAQKQYTLDHQETLCEQTLMAIKIAKIAVQEGKLKRPKERPKLNIVV